MKQQLHLLRGDMTKEQALATLSLSQYVGRLHVVSVASTKKGGSVYTLRKGHTLVLYFQMTGGEYLVAEASLDGEKWRASDAR